METDRLKKLPKNTVEFCCWADYALFTDPIYKLGGEKCSLQLPTYEAIKGMVSSVYWKPTIIWVIDALRVMKPIQTEVKGIRTLKMSGAVPDLSYYTYLKDCAYQVRAHFVFNENRPELEKDRIDGKHYEIARRMIEKGGRRDVFFGTRECQGYVAPCVFGEGEGFYDGIARVDFGTMYHGITYPDEAYDDKTRGKISVRYAPVAMLNGIIKFTPPEKCPLVRTVREAEIKLFGEDRGNFVPIERTHKEVFES